MHYLFFDKMKDTLKQKSKEMCVKSSSNCLPSIHMNLKVYAQCGVLNCRQFESTVYDVNKEFLLLIFELILIVLDTLLVMCINTSKFC